METVKCTRMICEWQTAFDIQLLLVVMIDGDYSIYEPISPLPYMKDICHLLFVFHVIGKKVTKCPIFIKDCE